MRGPHTHPPIPVALPLGPPVLAVPSARVHHLCPARGVLASAHAALGRECPAPPRPLPRAARDPQASLCRSAAPHSLLKWAGTPCPTSQVPPVKTPKPGLHPHQGQHEPARSSYSVSFGTSRSFHPSWTLGKSKSGGRFGRRAMLLTVRLCRRDSSPEIPCSASKSCLSPSRDSVPITSPFPSPQRGLCDLQPAPCPWDTALPTHSRPGGHEDPQGQGLCAHLQSTWVTSASSSFLTQQEHDGGARTPEPWWAPSQDSTHLPALPWGRGGHVCPASPAVPAKQRGQGLLLEPNPCSAGAQPAVPKPSPGKHRAAEELQGSSSE